MRKIVRPLLIGIAVVFTLNVLTWAVAGQERALLRGADIEEIAMSSGGIDTLYLFTGPAQERIHSGFEDFAPSSIEQLAEKLRSTGRTVMLDPRPLPLATEDMEGRELIDTPGSRAFAYDVGVERPFPLTAEVTRAVWAPGFAAHESALYVWFFGWWHVADTGFGIS